MIDIGCVGGFGANQDIDWWVRWTGDFTVFGCDADGCETPVIGWAVLADGQTQPITIPTGMIKEVLDAGRAAGLVGIPNGACIPQVIMDRFGAFEDLGLSWRLLSEIDVTVERVTAAQEGE